MNFLSFVFKSSNLLINCFVGGSHVNKRPADGKHVTGDEDDAGEEVLSDIFFAAPLITDGTGDLAFLFVGFFLGGILVLDSFAAVEDTTPRAMHVSTFKIQHNRQWFPIPSSIYS